MFDRPDFSGPATTYLKPSRLEIFVINVERDISQPLVARTKSHGGPENFEMSPMAGAGVSWTPDGGSVLIAGYGDRQPWRNGWVNDLYLFSVQDTNAMKVNASTSGHYYPSLAPDGASIAYIWDPKDVAWMRPQYLYASELNGANARLIDGGLDRPFRSIRWGADSKTLYGVYIDRGIAKLGVFDLKGQHRDLPVHMGASSDFSVARDGTIAFVSGDTAGPGQVAILKTNSKLQILTELNASLFQNRRLALVETISFPSARGGPQIEGFVTKPPDFEPTKQYPLVVSTHGGQNWWSAPTFDLDFQLLAAHGFVVLDVNVRGSGSYGNVFGGLSHDTTTPEIGFGDETQDLLGGVDAMLSKGYIDPSRLYITGGSWGGHVATWAIGHTNKFKAAVIWCPSVDWRTYVLSAWWGTTTMKQFPGPPWERPEIYLERSSLSSVDKITTPALIIAGEADEITPFESIHALFTALQIVGVESELMTLPDEPHWMDLYPSHHMAKIIATIDWFQKHGASVRTPSTGVP